MAGGGIVSVEQDPEKKDRYYALTGTGERLQFNGEPGKKLFSQYSEATADAGGFFKNAAAGALGSMVPGGGMIAKGIENISKSDAAPPPMVPQEASQPAGPAPTAPAQAPSPEAPTQAAPQGPAPGGPPQQMTTAPQQSGPLGYAAEGFDPATGKPFVGEAFRTPEGIKILRQGTRGTPGGLTALGKQTIEQMTETERTVAEARQLQQQGVAAGTRAAIEDVAAQKAYQDQREIEAFSQAQEADNDIKEIERQKQDKEIEFAKAKTMFTESRIDPDRYMKGNWLATLGMAFGAFGATLAKTPNFAQEFVQARIAQDIRAQETAIDLKGKHADNALADLNKTLGNLVDAKQAYKQFMTEAAAAKFSALGLRTQDAQLRAKYDEAAGALMGQYALQDQERKIGNQEKIYKDRLYYRQGTAGTAGGLYGMTQGSFKALSEEGRQNEELRLRQAADDKAKANAGKPNAVVSQQLAEIDAAQSGLRKMMQYHRDKGKPGVYTTGVLASDESQRLGADVEALAPIIGRGLEGNAPNEGTMKAIREGMLSASGDKIQTSAASYFRQLEEKKKALMRQAEQQQSPPGNPGQ